MLPEQWVASTAVVLHRPIPPADEVAIRARQLLGLSRQDSPIRDFIGEFIARGPITMMIERIEQAQKDGAISDEYDARMLAMTISSLSGFPFLMLPIVGPQLGIELEGDFPERLIEHNQKLLSEALRAQTENAS